MSVTAVTASSNALQPPEFPKPHTQTLVASGVHAPDAPQAPNQQTESDETIGSNIDVIV